MSPDMSGSNIVQAEGDATSYQITLDNGFRLSISGSGLTYYPWSATAKPATGYVNSITFSYETSPESFFIFASFSQLAETPASEIWGNLYYYAFRGADIIRGSAKADHLDGLSGDDQLYGEAGADVLRGGEGNDRLTGGTGDDVMQGGYGNDTYYFDDLGDSVTENASEGESDVIITSLLSVDLRSARFANIENAELKGSSAFNLMGTDADNTLVGNDGANSLYGFGGVDTLTGGVGDDILNGGLGADTMTGGSGNDTFYVDNAADAINESRYSEGGVDTIVTSLLSIDLINTGKYWGVENVTFGGSLPLNAKGYFEDNRFIGNSAKNILIGGLGDDFLDGGGGADLLEGGTGNDVFVVDTVQDQVVAIGDGVETVRSATISIFLDNYENVENAILTGSGALSVTGSYLANKIVGNSGANILDGGDGNDRLDGGAGADRMIGGWGSDTIYVDSIGDVVVENAADLGTDTVVSTISFTLGTNVENLTLAGSGAINGVGNARNNVLTGNIATNRLIGGAGNDLYVLGSGHDIVEDTSGTDTVSSSITRSLAGLAFIENLTLVGNLGVNGFGNSGNNVLIGNSSVNRLDGGAGNDTLDGGLADDILVGAAGNDTYVLRAAGGTDTIVDSAGIDTVKAEMSFTLSSSLENLTLTGTQATNGTGNAANNILVGNNNTNVLVGGAGNDTLDGWFGNDKLDGGLGNDTYIIRQTTPILEVTIKDAGGVDTVTSYQNFTLLDVVENLKLLGSANLNGKGNDGDNTLTGNSGRNSLVGYAGDDRLYGGNGADSLNAGEDNDYLSGGAGNDKLYGEAGADRLYGDAGDDILVGGDGNDILVDGDGDDEIDGGLGDDTYYLADGNDTYRDAGGIDTMYIGASLGFRGLFPIEILRLTGSGDINFYVIGDTIGNTLVGNSGENRLGAGFGNDLLTGGGGEDVFMFNTALNPSTNVDRISDFNVAQDTIELDNAIMAGLGATLGTLSAAKFWKSTSGVAHDADDRIIYDVDMGRLFYDANGKASGGAVQFATVSAGLALTYADFEVI